LVGLGGLQWRAELWYLCIHCISGGSHMRNSRIVRNLRALDQGTLAAFACVLLKDDLFISGENAQLMFPLII
jgi:hypothetical protein